MNYSTKVFLRGAFPIALLLLVFTVGGIALCFQGPIGFILGLFPLGVAFVGVCLLCYMWEVNQAE